MKKFVLCVAFISLVSSVVFAANFSPALLRLSAPPSVYYNFDGNTLQIPVTVTGTPALTTFFVYTKDKADQIVDINNGFLGWHYINKVDTCIYFSGAFSFDIGNQTISWNGKDKDGNKVPAGEYTYYLWAYDHQSPKKKVCYFENAIYPYLSGGTHIEEFGENGEPLANPWIHTSDKRWVIGNDPLDATLQETTKITYPTGWTIVRTSVFDPKDHKYFYITTHNKETSSQKVQKYQWVPNGDAALQDNWGTDLVFTNPWYGGSGPATNRDILYATYYSQYENGNNVNFYTIDFDGTLIQTFDMSEWFTRLEDYEKGCQMSGGPRTMVVRDGYAFLNHYGSCIKAMVNPVAEDVEDFFTWINQNGDYISDTNYAPDAKYPWVCFDFNALPSSYSLSADANHFSIMTSYDLGAITFALMGPDGTGINYFSYAGEAAGWKIGIDYVDNGSAFDGIYCDNKTPGGPEDGFKENEFTLGTYFVAHDSIKGILTSNPMAVGEGPAAFSVAQNSPNPFNPSTTISFTIPEAGTVTVDVFNVAGQKVATVANDFMSAGSHSVSWDASGFSAGVYFYTVKSSDFVKTMKMTLLK